MREFTFLEEYGLPTLDVLKRLVAEGMRATGKHLFITDGSACNDTLLFRMATEEQFLQPLRVFQRRRLLANLLRDFVVPLGTAAFLDTAAVQQLRDAYSAQHGIVTVLRTAAGAAPAADADAYVKASAAVEIDGSTSESIPDAAALNETRPHPAGAVECKELMRRGLDSVGWEKLIVHFKGNVPLAHNQIAALTKYSPLIDRLLGFNEGQGLISDTARWLTEAVQY